MNVLGLDLSSTGVAYPEGTASVYATKLTGTARLIAIRDKLAADLDTPDAPHVDLAVVEDLPINARSAGATGMLHGVIRVWLAEQHIPTGIPVMIDCSFCGLPLFIPGATEHPCCAFARARGDQRCPGCEGVRNDPRRRID